MRLTVGTARTANLNTSPPFMNRFAYAPSCEASSSLPNACDQHKKAKHFPFVSVCHSIQQRRLPQKASAAVRTRAERTALQAKSLSTGKRAAMLWRGHPLTLMDSEAAWKGAFRWRMPPPSLAILWPRSAQASPSAAACTTTAPQPSPNRMQVPAGGRVAT